MMRIVMKKSIKVILDMFWDLKIPKLENRILCYHSVHQNMNLSHRLDQFESQVNWLRAKGYHSVLVRDIPSLLKNNQACNDHWVAITFDDGYRDNVEKAMPILNRAGFVGTFFVVAGMIRDAKPNNSDFGHMLYENRPMMTAQDLKILDSEGMEIGSHSMTHRLATNVFKQAPDALLAELSESKKILEDATGEAVVSFAYPNGKRGAFSISTRQLVVRSNYQVAVTTMWGKISSVCDILELPRCDMSSTDTLKEFSAKIVGRRDYRSIVHRVLNRTKVWTNIEAKRYPQG